MFAQYLFLARVQFRSDERIMHARAAKTECRASSLSSGRSNGAIVRACEICSAPVQGRRATTCSDRCRAERWRQGQQQVRLSRDARVLRPLREAIRMVEEQAK
jgi:hypothetical protein